MGAFTHSFVEVDGCAVSLWRGGRGRPLLFLHGSQGVARPLPFMETLAADFDVIVPEHPGFGRSDTPAWFDNVHDQAYFYLDLLEVLRLEDVGVVGQSIGGWIAAEIAIRSTERISRLLLAGAPGLAVPDSRVLDVFALTDAELAPLLYCDTELAEAARRRAQDAAAEPVARKNRSALERLARRTRFTDPHLHKWLHRIRVPTLLVWGEQDRAVPPPFGRMYERLIPRARLVLLPGCGHLPHIEKARDYTAIVSTFMAEDP